MDSYLDCVGFPSSLHSLALPIQASQQAVVASPRVVSVAVWQCGSVAVWQCGSVPQGGQCGLPVKEAQRWGQLTG